MKTVLIGQAPSRTSDPSRPLSGEPLASKMSAICGLTVEEYLEKFERRNLIGWWPGRGAKGDLFPRSEARTAAAAMERALRGRSVVFLGKSVSAAFGFQAKICRSKCSSFTKLGFWVKIGLILGGWLRG